MQNAEMLEQAIRDRQVRYRHEAYRARPASRPLRMWLGTHLIQLGGLVRGDGVPPPAAS